MTSRTLFLSPRPSTTADALALAAGRRGMNCLRLADRRVPREYHGDPGATLFAGPLFADSVASELGLGLLEAPENWLARLPYELTGRTVELMSIAQARELRRPAFVKPPNDKSFPARIHADGSRLPGPDAVDDTVRVLVSDIVTFTAEFRLFVLDGEVVTGSRYAVHGTLDVAPLDADPRHDEVREFATRLFAPGVPTLPSAVVVDVGTLDAGPAGPQWAVVEANAAWASGHYACDTNRALDAVLRAANSTTARADQGFLRSPA